MKKVQRSSFKLNPIAASIILAMTAQLAPSLAHAGVGLVTKNSAGGQQQLVNTYYANSPSGPVPQLSIDPVSGLPTTTLVPGTNVAQTVDSGKALRKFVDGLPGIGATNANNLGQYIPVAVAQHNWVNPATGVTTADDYYEIAAVEYSEQMHSDLPKATHLRGYVQLMTPALAAAGVTGKSFTTYDGTVLQVVDNPHHLGPIISAASGTAVRVKFTNMLPKGGHLFLPVDTSITGAGLGPDGKTYYTQNRAEIHLVGGQAPWISAGSPHQWVAPAGETNPSIDASGNGVALKDARGPSNVNVPDMADPGAGSTTLYFPNAQSARFMFYQDRTSGLTRLNSYAGLEAGYFITDPTEQALITAGTIPGAANTLPLIIEDKTFVPQNIAQQDANWDTTNWGQPGDLWFPHVYETNQDPSSVDGTNPVGRWDYGPWFWPIFPAATALPFGPGQASATPEAYEDTPLVNGTAYPTVTVDPTAYRLRLLNASNDRFLNLGLYIADATQTAPQLDRNGNPIVDSTGKPLTFSNTEVKLAPALAAADGFPTSVARDASGNAILDSSGFPIQLPLPQYLDLSTYPGNALPISGGFLAGAVPAVPIPTAVMGMQQLTPTILFSGTTHAWPMDSRVGGAPDPTSAGPDFIEIGNEGGLLPHPVDVPSQPITYEQNRRSVTVTNVYGYGLLLGPSERKDTIVDFSQYAGKTLIVYNDAPAPFPFVDGRWDYFTGDPDLTANGGAYATKPGYGPNTRTVMQIKVNAAMTSGAPIAAFNAAKLAANLPAAYGATQPNPIVPESAYNAAFKTTDADLYAHVATGSMAQPQFAITSTGTKYLNGLNLVTSGGTQNANGTIVGNTVPGSGTGYLSAPLVNINFLNGGACATSLTGSSTVDPISHQVTGVTITNGASSITTSTATGTAVTTLTGQPIACTEIPVVTFTDTAALAGSVSALDVVTAGSGYLTTDVIKVAISGGGGTGAQATAIVGTSPATVSVTPGSGYTSPVVAVTGGGVTGVTGTAVIATSAATIAVVPGSGYTAPVVTVTGGGVAGVTGTATVGTSSATLSIVGGSGYTAPQITVSGGGVTGVTATATVGLSAASVSFTPGSGYSAPTVTVTGGGVAAGSVTGTATVGTSAATISFTPGSGYTAPVATLTGGGVPAGSVVPAVTFDDALGTVSGVPGAILTVTLPVGVVFTSAPSISITDPTGSGASVTATVAATAGTITGVTLSSGANAIFSSAPNVAINDSTGTGATATATVAANAGAITSVVLAPANAAFTAAPTFAITDSTGLGASVTATVAAPAGQITGVTLSQSNGFTSAPSIAISDPTGTGASATAAVVSTAGTITGVTLSPNVGFTSAPSISITDPTGTGAVATATVASTAGTITGFTITAPGTGYTSAPSVLISGGTGTGATASAAGSGVVAGIGAQAIITSSNTQLVDVRTKAEQELFDNLGRYNSTGGVELPLTTDQTQTTVPLAYIDAPTEIIDDATPVQVWKLVDNGFWSNSMHFDMVDVQLINRVGWDGTVKAPASDEVGWKDTLRLNPLEDVVIAMRAKPGQTPFGLPRSARYQDPSVPNGANGSGLGLTSDPGVVNLTTDTFNTKAGVADALLTTTTNTNTLVGSSTGNYDNEFVWGTAVLGHAENDFQRPVVYHPTVNAPGAATITNFVAGAITWADPTPAGAAATIANATNEIGFRVLRATLNYTAAIPTLNAFSTIGNLLANATTFTDKTFAAGTEYAYEIEGWNAVGQTDSAPYVILNAPATPTGVSDAVNPANGAVTMSWTPVTGATGYVVYVNGVAQPVQATQTTTTTRFGRTTTTVNATQTYAFSPALALGSNYTLTVAAQKAILGAVANSAQSSSKTANLSAPTALAVPTWPATAYTINFTGTTYTGVTLNWNAVPGASGYQVFIDGSTTPVLVTTNTYTVPASVAVTGKSHTFSVASAVTLFGTFPTSGLTTYSAASGVQTVNTTAPGVPSISSVSGQTSSGLTLNYSPVNGASATGYAIEYSTTSGGTYTQLATGTTGVRLAGATTSTTAGITGLAANTTYYFKISASNGFGSSGWSTTGVSGLTTPGQIVAPTTSAVTATSAKVTWIAPTGGATSYTVQASTSNTFGTIAATAVGTSGTPTTLTGLTGNTSYYFRVTATNNSGTTNGTSTTTAVLTPPGAFTGSGVPTATASASGVAVSWAAIAPAGGASTYTVQYATNAAFTTGTGQVTGVNGTSTTVTGLTGNTNYYFKVVANNASGTTTSSASGATLTVPNVPTGATALNGTVGGAITGGLSWNAVTGATSYTVSWTGPATGSTTVNAPAVTTGQLTFTRAGTYAMKVTANNASGSSAATTAVNVTVQ